MFVVQVSEAEAMVAGGVRDVFVSNEVVAPNKLQRLVALAAQGKWCALVRYRLLPRTAAADGALVGFAPVHALHLCTSIATAVHPSGQKLAQSLALN